MRDMFLLFRWRKNYYVAMLCLLGIIAIQGTLFNIKVESPVEVVYMTVSLTMLLFFCIFSGEGSRAETRAFLESLPVKKLALEMHTYVAMSGVFAIELLVVLVTNALLSAKHGVSNKIAGLAEDEFWMLCLALFTTWTFFYLISLLYMQMSNALVMGSFCWMAIYVQIGMWAKENPNIISPEMIGIILTIAILIMIALMILHTRRRDLSGGKECFLPVLDAVSIPVSGLLIYRIVSASIKMPVAVLVALSVMVFQYYKLYGNKIEWKKVEIRTIKKRKNPWLAYEMRGYLTATIITTLFVLANRVVYWRESSADVKSWIDLRELVSEKEFFNQIIQYNFAWKPELFAISLAAISMFACMKYMGDARRGSREFLESLPVSRKKRYLTKIGMDVGFILIPPLVYALVNIGYTLSYIRIPEPFFTEMLRAYAGYIWSVASCAIFALGIVRLVDAVVVGGFKVFNFYLTVQGICIVWMFLEAMYENFFKMEVIWSMIAMVGGILLLNLAGYLYVNRKSEKEYFYYKYAKHVFAVLCSFMFAFFVFVGDWQTKSQVIPYLIAALGAIVVYIMYIRYCSKQQR